MIDNMAFCLTPSFTKWYFWSNTHFCEEKTCGCGLDSSLQLFRTEYIIYKTCNRYIQDLAHLDISHWNNICVTTMHVNVMCIWNSSYWNDNFITWFFLTCTSLSTIMYFTLICILLFCLRSDCVGLKITHTLAS